MPIFSCKINDFVHADMSDISSLDEEIVINAVKFSEEKQTKVKALSNTIELIGKNAQFMILFWCKII